MPPFATRRVAIALDMAGCPNRCRHCWLGNPPNRRVPVETLRRVVAQFRGWALPGEEGPFIEKLGVFTWYREPDYAPNYRELWQLEQALSDEGEARRFELLSIWRLARDEGYAAWAREVGTEACQVTFFGLEKTTDHFTRRPGYFRDALLATERLLAAGIRPRWQIFLTEPALPELRGLVDLIASLDLERRVRALGAEFTAFLNLPSPDGEAWHLEPLRPTVEALAALPGYLAQKTVRHFVGPALCDCLGRAEADWLPELLHVEEPAGEYPEILAFNITPELDVYSNLAEPSPPWRLGNLGSEPIGRIMERFIHDEAPGLYARFHVPVGELARAYGRPGNRQLYSRSDLIGRWVKLWLQDH